MPEDEAEQNAAVLDAGAGWASGDVYQIELVDPEETFAWSF